VNESVSPAEAADVDPASLTYDVKLPWRIHGTGRCRSCGAPIAWAKYSVDGKAAPFNPDGTSHFATCPQADQWRKRP
jgi:hypothetical protein